MGLGIKTLIRNIISMTKEEKLIPVVKRPSSGHEFDGKVALITVGTGGIGLAIAKSLLESGCKVIISGTNEEKWGGYRKSYSQRILDILS